jgi:hypothetical protein
MGSEDAIALDEPIDRAERVPGIGEPGDRPECPLRSAPANQDRQPSLDRERPDERLTEHVSIR